MTKGMRVADTAFLESGSAYVSEHAEAVPSSRGREANSPDAPCRCGTWKPNGVCRWQEAHRKIARMLQGDRTAKQRASAAERYGQPITRRMGPYLTRRGADVAGWLVETTRRRALIQGKRSIPRWVNVSLEHRSNGMPLETLNGWQTA